jgi:hypothetical protein
MVGMLESVMHEHVEERIYYNTWAPGLPPQLAGRVNAGTWGAFINALSVLGESQPGACTQCLTCSCCAASAAFEAGLVAIEQQFGAPLGATLFARKTYTYQTWVHAQPATPPQPDGQGGMTEGQPGTPGHWQNQQLPYLEVVFAQPMQMVMAAAPAMAPPGVTMNPMMQPQPVMMQPPPMYAQQQQQPMYAQQQPMHQQQQQQYAPQQPQPMY